MKAALVSRQGWLHDTSQRVTATAVTNSDAAGTWRLDLVPTTDYQVEVCYRIVETCTRDTWYIKVPDAAEPDTEYWMRDLLVTPPTVSDCGYPIINRLAQLVDIDRPSIAAAKPGDVLTLLPSGKWGVSTEVEPFAVDWSPVDGQLLSVVAAVTGAGLSGARVEWGDGTTEIVTGPGPVLHSYVGPGVYTVTATDVSRPTLRATATVTVKDHLTAAHAYADPDDDWRVLVWVNEPADGTVYQFDFGDSTDVETYLSGPPPYPRVSHAYTALGTYPITVHDTATRRAATISFECARFGVLFGFPGDDYTPLVGASLLAAGATWEVDWGDGTPPVRGTVPAIGEMEVGRGAAMPAGTYTVAVRELVDGQVRREEVRDLVVPNQVNQRMGVGMDWNHAPQPKVLITATATPSDQTCTVTWGDGSQPEQVAGNVMISHTYPFTAPTDGWMLRVVEDSGQRRHFSRLLGGPISVAQPNLAAWAKWAISIHVQGIQGRTNGDWYEIQWGDGTASAVGAYGASPNAGHAYNAPGTYTIRFDSPGMPAPITRSVVVPTYTPQPNVDVTEDTSDATRMTALITIDNRVCGGPVTLTFADSTVMAGPESGQIAHTFAEPGSYWVIVACDGDSTARQTKEITVPFGRPGTLVAQIDQDPDGDEYSTLLTVTEHTPGRGLAVDWADGAGWEALATTQATHQYDLDGDYMVRVSYQDVRDEIVKLPFIIPWS